MLSCLLQVGILRSSQSTDDTIAEERRAQTEVLFVSDGAPHRAV